MEWLFIQEFFEISPHYILSNVFFPDILSTLNNTDFREMVQWENFWQIFIKEKNLLVFFSRKTGFYKHS